MLKKRQKQAKYLKICTNKWQKCTKFENNFKKGK